MSPPRLGAGVNHGYPHHSGERSALAASKELLREAHNNITGARSALDALIDGGGARSPRDLQRSVFTRCHAANEDLIDTVAAMNAFLAAYTADTIDGQAAYCDAVS